MKHIGLFGGSFDPIHLGHLLAGQAAREELALDRLFFVPAAQSPFKPEHQCAPAKERLLLRLALAGLHWCEIDDQEIQRGGISYTIETVRDYARRFPEAQLFYLIGADHVTQLPKWREAEELARLAHFAVIPRPQWGDDAPFSGAAAFDTEGTSKVPRPPEPPGVAAAGLDALPAQAAPAQFSAPFHGRALVGYPVGISSSRIRARIKAGLPIETLVPAAVAEAIRNNRLYL